jgi:hypothetical protein
VGRLVALLLGGFGLGAYLSRRRRHTEPGDSPAEELRSKLAESRAAQDAPAEEPPPELETELEQRRREVHDRARGAIDDLS